MPGVPIGGVQWTTVIDFPGRVAAVLFTIGCSFRCPFCHNPGLVDPDRLSDPVDLGDLWNRLEERADFLDGVVVSGGEPTVHPALPALLERIKRLGLRVKLDTNGSRPDVLSALLGDGLVDYVAMDVKAPAADYARLTGVAGEVGAVEASIARIRRDAPDYEFRTTVAPTLTRDHVLQVAAWLEGAKRYVLQAFRTPETGLLDSSWEARPALSKDELDALWEDVRASFSDGGVRG